MTPGEALLLAFLLGFFAGGLFDSWASRDEAQRKGWCPTCNRKMPDKEGS